MNNVFVLGSLNMDFIINVSHMPKVGETIQGKGFQTSPGGKGSNQAIALSKQKVNTFMLGSVGDDMIGKEIIDSLSEHHVHKDYVQRLKNQTSGIAMIILEDDDNRIITSAGANAYHDIKQIKHHLKMKADKDDYLLAQLEIPSDIIEEIFEYVKELGMKTILNAAPIKPLGRNFLCLVDLIVVNETEAEKLLNHRLDLSNLEEELSALCQLGPKEVILTLGKQGSYYSNQESMIYTPAFTVDKVIDTTGAGDAFIGCYLAKRIEKKPINIALKYASACGALTVTKKGVHHAIPFPNEIDEFMQERGDNNE